MGDIVSINGYIRMKLGVCSFSRKDSVSQLLHTDIACGYVLVGNAVFFLKTGDIRLCVIVFVGIYQQLVTQLAKLLFQL